MILTYSLVVFISCLIIIAWSHIPEDYIRHENGCAWSPLINHSPVEFIRDRSKLPQNILSSSDLPSAYSWDNINGNSLVTTVMNQFMPNPCGSCWAVAAMGALSDRLKIQTYENNNNQIPTDINLSPQYLLDCCIEGSGTDISCGSCNGGNSGLAYKLISETGISDNSCSPYLGIEPSHWAEVTCDTYECRTCNRLGVCYYVTPKLQYFVDEYGEINKNTLNSNLTMEEAMRSEIMSRGPISCLMYAHAPKFENYNGTTGYQDGVIVDNVHYNGTTHFVALIGWGETSDGLQYWIGRNSFGTIWGKSGFFFAQRGVNIYNMEETCYWATIKM